MALHRPGENPIEKKTLRVGKKSPWGKNPNKNYKHDKEYLGTDISLSEMSECDHKDRLAISVI